MIQIKTLFFCALIFCSINVMAQDTIKISSHQNTHLPNYGGYNETTLFPDNSEEFRSIIMSYTLGCPSSGCSQWDYTTQVFILHRPGTKDSTLKNAPQFKLGGSIPDSLYIAFDTSYSYFFNENTMMTDSMVLDIWEVVLFEDSLNPNTPTDTLFVWPSPTVKYSFNSSGDTLTTDTLYGDSLMYQIYWPYYDVFDVVVRYELARLITPYAGNYPNTFKNVWHYDVTDFEPLLHDSVEIQVFYSGYQNGFTASLDFEFVKGTPNRKVLDIKNIYSSGPGGFRYGDSGRSIEEDLNLKRLKIPTGTKEAKLRVTHSGHSFGGAENCAEFCPKNYYLKVNGVQKFVQSVWRNDCGLNPLYPQAGTWVSDRANWCPGEKALTREHYLFSDLESDSIDIDMNMDSYTYLGGAGFHPNYIIESQLVFYEQNNHQVDGSIIDIIAPSDKDQHRRENPICSQPKIMLKNEGLVQLKTARIRYGQKGSSLKIFSWVGELDPGKAEEVVLPSDIFGIWEMAPNNIFMAEVYEVNGAADLNTANNFYFSSYDIPKVYPSNLIVEVKTNLASNENNWYVENQNGIKVFESLDISVNSINKDTLNLPVGCYTFIIDDSSCDGLYYPFNNDGSGYIRFRDGANNNILKNIPGNFGCQYKQQFSVGYTVDINENQINSVELYPNPTEETAEIILKNKLLQEVKKVTLYSIIGEKVMEHEINSTQLEEKLSIIGLKSGIYLVQVELSDTFETHKLIIK